MHDVRPTFSGNGQGDTALLRQKTFRASLSIRVHHILYFPGKCKVKAFEYKIKVITSTEMSRKCHYTLRRMHKENRGRMHKDKPILLHLVTMGTFNDVTKDFMKLQTYEIKITDQELFKIYFSWLLGQTNPRVDK